MNNQPRPDTDGWKWSPQWLRAIYRATARRKRQRWQLVSDHTPKGPPRFRWYHKNGGDA
jgi:hypothetical protein